MTDRPKLTGRALEIARSPAYRELRYTTLVAGALVLTARIDVMQQRLEEMLTILRADPRFPEAKLSHAYRLTLSIEEEA
jgi:hypothetical protein